MTPSLTDRADGMMTDVVVIRTLVVVAPQLGIAPLTRPSLGAPLVRPSQASRPEERRNSMSRSNCRIVR